MLLLWPCGGIRVLFPPSGRIGNDDDDDDDSFVCSLKFCNLMLLVALRHVVERTPDQYLGEGIRISNPDDSNPGKAFQISNPDDRNSDADWATPVTGRVAVLITSHSCIAVKWHPIPALPSSGFSGGRASPR